MSEREMTQEGHPRPRRCPVCGTELPATSRTGRETRRDRVYDRRSCRDVAYRRRLEAGEVVPRDADRLARGQEVSLKPQRRGRLMRLGTH
jgi:hypothetical protein